MNGKLVILLLMVVTPHSAFSEKADIMVLHAECHSSNKSSCLSAGKIYSKERNYRAAADMYLRGCSHGSTEACGLHVTEEAKDGNFDGFSEAVSHACDAGHRKYCSMSNIAKVNLFDKVLKVADPDLYGVWLNGSRVEVLEQAAQVQKEARVAESSLHCESGAISRCVSAGKALLEKESFRDALELLEKACDRKSSEACELAGIAASKLEQGEYALNLVGIACKLGRLSACRLQGKIAQDILDRVKSDQEVERQRQVEAHGLAERKAQERRDQVERERTNAALIAASAAIGRAISGGESQKSKNIRRCSQKKNPFGNGWETVCEDSDY